MNISYPVKHESLVSCRVFEPSVDSNNVGLTGVIIVVIELSWLVFSWLLGMVELITADTGGFKLHKALFAIWSETCGGFTFGNMGALVVEPCLIFWFILTLWFWIFDEWWFWFNGGLDIPEVGSLFA